MRLIENTTATEHLIPIEEQYDIASWEVLIRVLQEIGKLPAYDIDDCNSYILEFCRAFNNNEDEIIEQLKNWSQINPVMAPLKPWSLFRIGYDLGFYDKSGNLNYTAIGTLAICSENKDELTLDLLNQVKYERFSELIENSIEDHASKAMSSMNNMVFALDYLSNIRDCFKFYVEE